jgi:hypothetical protein
VQPVTNAYGIAKRNGNCYRDCDRHGYSDGNGNCHTDGNCYGHGNSHSHGDRYGYRHPNGDSGTEGYSITETSSDTTAPTVRRVDRRSVISLLFGNSRANLASSLFIPHAVRDYSLIARYWKEFL